MKITSTDTAQFTSAAFISVLTRIFIEIDNIKAGKQGVHYGLGWFFLDILLTAFAVGVFAAWLRRKLQSRLNS